MKKTAGRTFLCLALVVLLIVPLVSCELEDSLREGTSLFAADVCHVTFADRGEVYTTSEVRRGESLSMPEPPERSNYLFHNWFTDAQCTQVYDFSGKVEADLTLYAGWIPDAASLTNQITDSVIRATVTVYNRCYNTRKLINGWDTGIETESTMSQGSGVIFYHPEQSDEYVLLTNCHVVCVREGYEKQEITVVDYLGNSYTATVEQDDDGRAMISPDYDLACLRFHSSEPTLGTLDISRTNPVAGDDVIAVGTPAGQRNAITFGRVLSYRTFTLQDAAPQESNVTFEVICHSSHIESGSSGGVLLNSDLKIAGINYAGNSDEETHLGPAIPASGVIAFLEEFCDFDWNI